MFFQRRDSVHQTMRRMVKRLEKAGISYAIVGGMALNAHGYRRTTGDVDFLLTSAGFKEFCETFVGENYERSQGRKRRFIDRQNGVTIDILVTGLYPGTGKRGQLAFPDPAKVSETRDEYRVVNLRTLIELKLAARRWRDFADVVELVRLHCLDRAYSKKLHASVRKDFIECLEEMHREDEYEAREGE